MKRRTVTWLKAVGVFFVALLVNHWVHVAYVSDFLESVITFVLAVLLTLPLTRWRMFGGLQPLEDAKYDPIEGDGGVTVRLDACGPDLVAVLSGVRLR